MNASAIELRRAVASLVGNANRKRKRRPIGTTALRNSTTLEIHDGLPMPSDRDARGRSTAK
jgi:hypothetical protein